MDLPYRSIKESLIAVNNLSLSIVDMFQYMTSIVAFAYYSM